MFLDSPISFLKVRIVNKNIEGTKPGVQISLVIVVVALELRNVPLKGRNILGGHAVLDANLQHVPGNHKLLLRGRTVARGQVGQLGEGNLRNRKQIR